MRSGPEYGSEGAREEALLIKSSRPCGDDPLKRGV